MSFHVIGSDGQDTLAVTPNVGGAAVVLRVPIQCLPWRDLRLIEKHGRREAYGCCDRDDPLANARIALEKADQVTERTGIEGATALRLEDGIATIAIAPGATLVIPCIRVAQGAKMPAVVQIVGKAARRAGTIRVVQLAAGRRVGGVTMTFGKRRGNEG